MSDSDSSGLLTVLSSPDPVPGRYIVVLKGGVSLTAHLSSTQSIISSSRSNITHHFELISGYAGEFTTEDLNQLRANPDIYLIEEDGVARTYYETQKDAPWGLGRITSTKALTGSDLTLNYTYNYDDAAVTNATVYVIDTGIYTAHPDFGQRATWGMTFGGYEDKDGNGHGTHCAGIAVSTHYGVAKNAQVVAVKVLGDNGRGYNSDVISGVNWVADEAARTGNPSVASMSLGSSGSTSLDMAVRALQQSGVTVAVAAGNDNMDCSNTSPARVREVITVAASTFQDTRASFSNYGPPIDIFAPGMNITSTWNDGNTKVLSGTSMAAAHVSGFAAYLLGLDSSLTPDQIALIINERSIKGILGDVPTGTANKLLNNQIY